MNYIEQVREFINDNILFGEADQLQADTSFAESGILDSTAMLELIVFLEDSYGIQINNDELIPDNLDSLAKIEMFLNKKLGQAAQN